MGQIYSACCKKREKTPEEIKKEEEDTKRAQDMMDKLMGKTRTDDLIEQHGQTSQFKHYIK